jgi:hypothetical protein
VSQESASNDSNDEVNSDLLCIKKIATLIESVNLISRKHKSKTELNQTWTKQIKSRKQNKRMFKAAESLQVQIQPMKFNPVRSGERGFIAVDVPLVTDFKYVITP